MQVGDIPLYHSKLNRHYSIIPRNLIPDDEYRYTYTKDTWKTLENGDAIRERCVKTLTKDVLTRYEIDMHLRNRKALI